MKTIILDGVEYQLVPVVKKDADGWIEWNGGECPVPGGTMVDVRYREEGESDLYLRASCFRWNHVDSRSDIVAYRLSEEQ